jgi:glycosyltransferase involved in cell wall biosynthesis
MKISIAVIAFNEESNIFNIFDSIYKQTVVKKHKPEIILISDGSTDKTVEITRKNFKSVKIFDNRSNLGKNKRFNQLMSDNNADILFQLDADIKLKNNYVLDHMIKKFTNSKDVGIVCSYEMSENPTTFAQNISYFGFKVWDTARNNLGQKAIRYHCEGSLRGFSKNFTKIFRLPTGQHIGEDSFSFYYAIKNGFNVVFAKKAVVYQPLPLSLNDYHKQMKRFLSDPEMIQKYFDQNLIRKYETMTPVCKIKSYVKEFVQNPTTGLIYLINQLTIYIQMLYYKPPEKWSKIERGNNK